jgi:glycosyltransferase involved in cell wall biosynthesis
MTAEAVSEKELPVSDPLVSVVVPVYNVARLLPRCLDSLLAQTYRPLEIIVVDDGSHDASYEVMRSYELEHPEVRTIRQRHRGLGPARNIAIGVAAGEYVTMADADDWAEPDMIADLVGIAGRTGADVVIGNFSFDSRGLRLPFPFLPRRTSFTGLEAAELSINMLRVPAFAWVKLYRASLFTADDAPFPTILYEDLATTPRILAKANTVALTRKVYYHYCLRADSIVGAFRVKNVFSFAAAIDILRHDLVQQGRWQDWQASYRRLLRQAFVMVSLQVLFQRNEIPWRARGPLVLRYARKLRSLASEPTGTPPMALGLRGQPSGGASLGTPPTVALGGEPGRTAGAGGPDLGHGGPAAGAGRAAG